jgi:hypothetical protein
MDGIQGQAYRWPMKWGRIRNFAIALSAAYAVALQALFLSFIPLSAVALTESDLALCAYQDGNGGTGHPEQHQIPCVAVCAAMGHGIGGANPPLVADVLIPKLIAAALEPLTHWVVPGIVDIGPQTSRGPPIG